MRLTDVFVLLNFLSYGRRCPAPTSWPALLRFCCCKISPGQALAARTKCSTCCRVSDRTPLGQNPPFPGFKALLTNQNALNRCFELLIPESTVQYSIRQYSMLHYRSLLHIIKSLNVLVFLYFCRLLSLFTISTVIRLHFCYSNGLGPSPSTYDNKLLLPP